MIANKPFENVAKFKYLGDNSNKSELYSQKKIKIKLNLGNDCYLPVQNKD
jgi:hypothetical protein